MSNRGYVTSVHLYQLVEIYNRIGDKLFKRNVRYGLNEQLGVDRAIKDTLRNNPGEFWFKNNGITILVERPDFRLDRVEEVLLEHISEYGDLHFSVINGAQTITASAQCLYEMEYDLKECINKGEAEEAAKLEEKIRQSKNAKVLLRIIHIPHSAQAAESEADSTREVNEISVALNRQKPIKAEDIAFASPFVVKLAAFLEREQMNGKRYFRLVKRGEGNIARRTVDLVDFARARKACAGYPGDARSKGTNVLLSSRNDTGGEYSFQDKTIFVPEWLEAEDEQEAEIFEKYYGAVYFAVRVADFYGKNVKKIITDNPAAAAVLQNGKWYFTTYMVQLFNGYRSDYSQFTDCFELIRDKLKDMMELFAELCGAAAQLSGNYPVLDSNGNTIVLPNNVNSEKAVVTTDGQVGYYNNAGAYVSMNRTIGLSQFNNPAGLEKAGSNLLRATNASGAALNEATNANLTRSKIHQSYLEGSNVQVADEMVNLIVAQRAYQLNSKAITTSDDMLEQANNLKR